MTSLVFRALYNSKAGDTANWTPDDTPGAMDTMRMVNGPMFVQLGDLTGKTLTLGDPQSVSNEYIVMSPNSVLATTTASGSTVNAVIHVQSRATVTLGQGYPSTANYDVDIAQNSLWLGTYDGELNGGLVVNGPQSARFENDGNSVVGGTHAVINVDVVGVGTFSDQSAQGHLGFLEFGRSVAAGQTVTVDANPNRGKSTLVLDDAKSFHGKINLGSGMVDLKNVNSGSYNYHGDELDLYMNGKVVDSLHIAMQLPKAPGWNSQPMVVERHGADILISQGLKPMYSGDPILFNRGT